MGTGEPLSVIRERLEVKNWLTKGLLDEIAASFPRSSDIGVGTGSRDKTCFEENCQKLFPTGRIFASNKQVEQAACRFLEAWAIHAVHDGKKIMCHYGVSSRKKRPSQVAPGLTPREMPTTRKEETKCPFRIHYSWVDYAGSNKKPGIFYRAKITTLHLAHTCQMNPQEHRIAIQKSGHLEVDVYGMKDILSLMQEKPRVSAEVLRPMMLRYISVHQGISAKFIGNFRRRVILFLVRNPDFSNLTYDQAVSLTSGRHIAAEEMTDLDDPFIRQNFSAMLRRIMAEDPATWEALTLMDDLKVSSPGFDYRVKKDVDGRPTGLMYMTAQMRYHARRYGSVLCLDAQKRQYNSSGWPYIAPVVKDNEMKVAVAAESIVTEETHEFYIWILQSMTSIEPRFQLSDIRLVFADQKITPTVLHDLGIEETCTLRGDFYHLLNEVWPDHFHPSVYPTIKKFLSAMLLSKTQEEWESAYACAGEVLVTRPRMKSALDDIYNSVEQYAGFFLRGIEGNLMMNGDVSAEQNHSGVVAYLGEGAAFAVAEQMTHLLKRQQNLDKLRRQKEDDQYVRASRYDSTYREPKYAMDDVTAKKTFSGYGFTELWTRTIKRSFYLQSEVNVDGSFSIWPTKEKRIDRTEESTVILVEGQRCVCQRRIAYSIQCEHEYIMDGGLDICKYHHRWYHRQTFDKLLPNLAAVFHSNRSLPRCNPAGIEDVQTSEPVLPLGDDDDSLDGGAIDFQEEDGDRNPPGSPIDDNDSDSDKENPRPPKMAPVGDKVTFQQLQERANELGRAVQNDQVTMITVLCNLNQMIDRVRLGRDIHIQFGTGLLDTLKENETVDTNGPRSAVFRALNNATGVKRKQSGREYHSRHRRKHRKAVTASQVVDSNDDFHLPPANVRTRACGLCRNKGHGRQNCPLVTMYGAVPLEKNNVQIRERLSRNLSIISKYEINHRPVNDERSIFTELPALKEVKGLVIHRRYLINSSLFNPRSSENLSLECTVLHSQGLEHPSYTRQLFNIDCIAAFIIRSKANLILCQLEESTSTDLPQSQPPAITELSQQSYVGLSQYSQNHGRPVLSQQSCEGLMVPFTPFDYGC